MSRGNKWLKEHPERKRELARAHYKRNRQTCLARRKRWAEENPDKAARLKRKTHLRQKYGISIEQYEMLALTQEYKCAACGDPVIDDVILHVDHDHSTGELRGLLCQGCNLAIGHAKDDPVRLEKAAAYLRRTGKLLPH